MWHVLILTGLFLQMASIVSANETCWPTANNLTCVLNDLLLGYNKQLRPNHTGRRQNLKSIRRRSIALLGDPIHVQVYMMVITLGRNKISSGFLVSLFFSRTYCRI